LAPGGIEIEGTHGAPWQRSREGDDPRHAAGPFGQPDDIARVAVFLASPMIFHAAHRRAPHGIRWLPIRRRPGPRPRRLAANKEEHRGPDRELSRPRGLKMREDVPVARADRHSVRGCGFLPHSAKRASYAGSIYRSLNRAFSNDCPAVAPKKSGPIPSGSLPPIALNEAPCCDGACANCAARF
jgi:hypothetical protein